PPPVPWLRRCPTAIDTATATAPFADWSGAADGIPPRPAWSRLPGVYGSAVTASPCEPGPGFWSCAACGILMRTLKGDTLAHRHYAFRFPAPPARLQQCPPTGRAHRVFYRHQSGRLAEAGCRRRAAGLPGRDAARGRAVADRPGLTAEHRENSGGAGVLPLPAGSLRRAGHPGGTGIGTDRPRRAAVFRRP